MVVGGGALPAVRVELNPSMLNKYGIGLEQVRTAIAATNANTPKGQVSVSNQRWEIGANDQLLKAIDYSPLIVAYRNGAPVRIRDVGAAEDSIEDIRTAGYVNGKPAVMVIIFRQPGANIIKTVDAVREVLPRVKAAISPAIDVDVVIDQTTTIRASVRDVERALIISIVLVILVVFAFLRSPRTAMIPSVAVPLSLIGTFGVMYLLGYGLDNLSLMALTISTGFVVDDAIVVIENITRYREQGKGPLEAALEGAQEIGFTVMSMSLSLVAVFIPLLLMSGIVGRLFREFAVTMAAAIVISMVVSLTATPMMCAHLLKKPERHGRLYQWSERVFAAVVSAYGRTLEVVLRYAVVTLLILIGTIGLTGYLFLHVPKGFFPQQDTGRLDGAIQADQGSSFQSMNELLLRLMEIVKADPAVANTVGFSGGGGTTNTARLFIALKPLAERNARADEVIARLRPKLGRVPGATLYLQASQDVRVGGRQSNAQYQFTMQGDNLDRSDDLRTQNAAGAAAHPDHQRREQRSAEPRAAGARELRPRRGRAVRHYALTDRRDAVRRVRTAPGLDDVSRPESVSRGHGSRTAVLAERHVVERAVRAVAAGPGSAAERLCQLVAGDRAAVRQPSGALSRGDDLVQPGTRYRAR